MNGLILYTGPSQLDGAPVRLWHLRQMGLVRRLGRGQYEVAEVRG